MSALFGDAEPESDAGSKHDPLEEPSADAPLAERMRPRTLAELVGQEHLVAEGELLHRAIELDKPLSLILWGPPGCGKTTIARMLARSAGLRFVPFSAVLSGIAQVREVMREAGAERRRGGKPTLLFVDEIHRFNKAQQDAFLPFVESGDIVLVGATTENPSFELNGALLSRLRVLILQPLSVEQLALLLRRALADPERGLGHAIRASDEVLERIAHFSDGDARRALVALETAASLVPRGAELDMATLARALQRKIVRHDKSGEAHYDLISALHKSIRNSDADAALYWLARLIEGGEDGNFVSRRLVRMAIEDIGLADVRALSVARDAADAYHRLGSPEGDLALAQAAVYLARAPKSNRLYVAFGQALEDVRNTSAEPVPLHLRNAPTKLMREAGWGEGYRYAHDDPAAASEMECLPPSLRGKRYFRWKDEPNP